MKKKFKKIKIEVATMQVGMNLYLRDEQEHVKIDRDQWSWETRSLLKLKKDVVPCTREGGLELN